MASTSEPLAIGSLHLGDLLPGRRPGRPPGLDGGGRDRLDAVGDELDGRRGGVHDARDDRGEAGGAEQREHRDQVDERRDRLAGVQHRPDAEVDPTVAGHPDAEDQGQDHHQDRGDQRHVQGDHRVVPQVEVQMPARQTSGDDQRRGRRRRRRRGPGSPSAVSHQGDSAISDCIGLRKPVGDEVLERRR